MYWLAPPSTRRWVAAGLIVAAAIVWDLWPEPVVLHPHAATDLAAGTVLEPGDVDLRSIPVGVVPPVDPVGVLAVAVAAGEPLVPSHLTTTLPPDGWWVIDVDLPPDAVVGQEVRLGVPGVGDAAAALYPGVVTRSGGVGAEPGSVAVPEDVAGPVAAASTSGRIVVLLGAP